MNPTDSPPRVVETAPDLAALAAEAARHPRLALDTEADSLHAFREKVCVVQLATDGGDAIVDALAVPDLGPLRDLAASGRTEIVFHGGDYDIGLLRRDHAFEFPRVFDTMVAATLLGEPQVGLAALLEKSVGVRLDKRFQKSDWRRRPFGPAELDYLRSDVTHLLALRDRLGEALVAADLVEEADIEFRRLAARSLPPPADDPDAWRRVKGIDRLDPRSRAAFLALFRWRDEVARRRDVPRFKVVSNEALLALAAWIPLDEKALGAMREVPPPVARRHGEEMLAALREGAAAADRGEIPDLARGRPGTGGPGGRESKARDDALRLWRTEEAKRRGVPNVVVLPNAAIDALLRTPPRDVESLAALPDVGPKRAARYGDEILRRLR